MFGQTSASGQWPAQGSYSRPTYKSDQEPQGYSQSWPSIPDTSGMGQNWPDTAVMPPRSRDTTYSQYGQNTGTSSSTYSGQHNSLRNSWQETQPTQSVALPSLSRKRPLLMEENDFPNSNYTSRSRSDAWPATRSEAWPETRSEAWPETRSEAWPVSKSDAWPTSRSDGGTDLWSVKPDKPTWPKPNAWTKSDNWSRTRSDVRSGLSSKPFNKFPRTGGYDGNFRPKPRRNLESMDISNSIITTYYVNQQKVNMPKELTSKFEALKCDLCGVLVNSTVTAKTHYSGKMHDKKVAQFMQKWFTDKGEPIPEQFKEGVPRKPATNNSEAAPTFYCKVCDIPLTSKQHAEQHYMGKGHQNKLKDGGSKKVAVRVEKSDPTGRFHIGKGFLKSSDPLGLMQTTLPDGGSITNPYACQLCGVSTTSKEQLDTHLGGARHRKKLTATTNPTGTSAPSGEKKKIPPPPAKSDTILATVVQRPNNAVRAESKDATDDKKKDFSIFRTPSGQFYCASCNVTMNSEMQFGQHNESKRHKLALAKGKTIPKSPVVVAPKSPPKPV